MNSSTWLVVALGLALALGLRGPETGMQTRTEERVVGLPSVVHDGGSSVESVLRARRSVREYARAPLALADVAQLAWAAQGETSGDGRRTAPSAGALYPLELHLVAGDIEGLEPGVYRYRPQTHHLLEVGGEDVREALRSAALDQAWVGEAPCVLVISAVPERTTGKYGRRGERYVVLEAGAAVQNVCLQATALDLGSVVVGAFDDARVRRLLGLDALERPLVLLPVGRRR